MKKRVFITGAAGFIGFHLAKALKKRGDEVVGYDNFNSYYDTKLKDDRKEELKKIGVIVLKGDICNFDKMLEQIEQFSPTHIVHLAAQAGVRYSLENPQAYIKANIEGFLNVLEVCRKHPKIKLTYASSSSIYGLNQTVPFSLDQKTDKQASLYGVTKKSNELMAESYHHLFGLSVTGLRFFTVYGPWGRPDMAYFSFTKAIIEGKKIPVFNHGKMERDFTYIDDIIDGVMAAVDLGAKCEIFNLGNHQSEKLESLISIIEEELGIKAECDYKPMQQGDVLSTFADISEAQEKLKFLPKTSLKLGIPKFIKWYKEYMLV